MGEQMHLYVIVRRDSRRSRAARHPASGQAPGADEPEIPDDIRWIRSYVIDQGDGAVGTVCIYQATSRETIREHARRADLAVDEIIPIADTVVVRPDPLPLLHWPADPSIILP